MVEVAADCDVDGVVVAPEDEQQGPGGRSGAWEADLAMLPTRFFSCVGLREAALAMASLRGRGVIVYSTENFMLVKRSVDNSSQ